MKKSVLGVIIAVVALLAIGGVVLSNKQRPARNTAPPDNNTNTNQATDTGDNMGNMESTPNDASRSSESAATDKVEIKDFAFTPSKITVKKGTTVTWTNQDTARHDITPDRPGEEFKASQLLAKGESYSFTFNTAGTYSYYCSPHPYMKASVEVTD